MSPSDPVSSVKGIGAKKAKLLLNLGIKTIRDLLYYMPRDYEKPGQRVLIEHLRDGQPFTIAAVISGEPHLRRIKNGLNLVTISLKDETGGVEAVFFNQPYMKNIYREGEQIYVSGCVKRVGRRLSFTNPSIDRQPPAQNGYLPIYPLTAGLTQKSMRILVRAVLDAALNAIEEQFPNDFRSHHGLCEVGYALANIHFPENERALELAKKRLIFEELLLLSIALEQRENTEEQTAPALSINVDQKLAFINRLGYPPTAAQMRVMQEIEDDLMQPKPMNRLLQGDVGSGKTTPAFYAMHICVQSGFQCVLMVPTEVLAAQHFAAAQRIFSDVGINIELLTGSTSSAKRRMILENIAGGLADIVIGTHAVLYDNVAFARLGLIVTDEQHRFGTGQRAMLEAKSAAPHILVMSATPIPRTLALILYGKTNLSVIDEMPPGRKPVKTFCVCESKRADMYDYIKKEIGSGAQVFVVCPLVEEGELENVRSSEQVYSDLVKQFGAAYVALLHGRMKPQEKHEVMSRFKAKECSILVSTTVIEVGVDVPDATIMVIENAERFGLAQLHQLRGRVGRGQKPSYCFLMSEDKDNARVSVLCRTNDGFQIAEEDLRQRGPGQFLGSRQSGGSDLYMAGLMNDLSQLEQIRKIAAELRLKSTHLYHQLAHFSYARFADKFDKTTIN